MRSVFEKRKLAYFLKCECLVSREKWDEVRCDKCATGERERERPCVCVFVTYCVCVHVYSASASSCPTAYKLSAAIMEEGPQCVKDKSGVCHRWEITVIYEGLSLQQQVNMLFGGLSAISLPFCTRKETLAGMYSKFTYILVGQNDALIH